MFVCSFVTLRVSPLDSEISCYYYYCSVTLRVLPLDSEMSCYYYYCSVTLRVPPWIL